MNYRQSAKFLVKGDSKNRELNSGAELAVFSECCCSKTHVMLLSCTSPSVNLYY